jgi:hypothetical protein
MTRSRPCRKCGPCRRNRARVCRFSRLRCTAPHNPLRVRSPTRTPCTPPETHPRVRSVPRTHRPRRYTALNRTDCLRGAGREGMARTRQTLRPGSAATGPCAGGVAARAGRRARSSGAKIRGPGRGADGRGSQDVFSSIDALCGRGCGKSSANRLESLKRSCYNRTLVCNVASVR